MPRDARAPILASIACALLLAPLALLAYTVGPTAHIDAELLIGLAEHDFGRGHALASFFGHLADPVPTMALLAALLLLGAAVRRGREALAALAVVAGANLTTQILKHALAHPRFQAEFAGFHQPWANAFPSGHATGAASIAVALLFVAPPRLRPLAAGLGAAYAAAVGSSVIVLQWHYPSDVVGALLVVGSWTFAAVAALRLLRPRHPDSPPRERRETASGRFAVSLQ
jgi:membrane-associated phospholipid phosphatase